MESNKRVEYDAASQLEQWADMSQRAPTLEPTRGYWLTVLWVALMLSAYMAVFLMIFGGQTQSTVSARQGGYSLGTGLLVPVLMMSGLIAGARERFAVRKKPSALQWVGYAVAILGFLALGTLSLTGVPYPGWLNALVPLSLLITMAAQPVRGLMRSAPAQSSPPARLQLSKPVRVVTALIGAVLGLLLASTAHSAASAFAILIVMPLLIAGIVASRSSFALPRVGYEWGPIHWISFGASTVVVFISMVLVSFTDHVTSLIPISAGMLVAGIMTAAALYPQGAPVRED